MHHEDELMQFGLELLAQTRADRSAWPRVQYSPDEEGKDVNARARLQLAWALQRQFESTDVPLLRFALEEEITWRENDPWQGIGETLEILAACLAQQRDVHDVWLLARAKQANFDTHCGFDVGHAFAAGVTKTIAFVQSSDHPARNEVLRLLLDEDGVPPCDDQAIDKWLARRLDQLPTDEEQRARVWFERALALHRLDIASRLLDAQMARGPRDADTLRAYAHDLEALERWPEASALRQQCFAAIADPFDQAGEAVRIASLERAGQTPENAENWLRLAARLHYENTKWRQVGLARMFVEECFRCATALGPKRGAEMFSLGEAFAQVTPRLPLVALEAAVQAAKTLSDPALSKYERRRAREARRIEKLCGKG